MSMYTTKVLDILRNYALPETNQTFDELINATYQNYFNFDFPWYADDDNSKVEFEKLYLLHFLMYEIGQETIELHRSRVAQRLRLIMPEMKQLWDSLNIDMPWLQNVDVQYSGNENETSSGTHSDKSSSTDTSSSNSTRDSSITGTSEDTSSSNTVVNTQSIDSDNPQVNFSGTDYASSMNRGETSQDVSSESTGTTTSKETTTTEESGTKDNESSRSGETSGTRDKSEARTERGNRGMSRGDIVKQMRDAVYNVNQEIINRCEDLFMLVLD